MAAYDQAHGQRILDYFDEHYYFDTSTPAAQLASTRTLWDPTYNGGTWVEQYEFDGPMQLIPRFRSWISTYYPGTLLSLSEYSIDSGQKSIVDAIAEMDVLGIFGQQPIDFANMWSAPAPTDPIAYSFRMFRNYDGNGSQFGDTSISATSTNPGELSIYAAQRSSDNAVTILAINKTTGALSSAIAIANLNPPANCPGLHLLAGDSYFDCSCLRRGDHQRLYQLHLSQLLRRLVRCATASEHGHFHNNCPCCINHPNHRRTERDLQRHGYSCSRVCSRRKCHLDGWLYVARDVRPGKWSGYVYDHVARRRGA